jgi:hypothetical protein
MDKVSVVASEVDKLLVGWKVEEKKREGEGECCQVIAKGESSADGSAAVLRG